MASRMHEDGEAGAEAERDKMEVEDGDAAEGPAKEVAPPPTPPPPGLYGDAPAAVGGMADAGGGDGDDEKRCRICFETPDESGEDMVSPCACKGTGKWIHMSCLRRWQRMVVVQQPTHPMFWRDDERHRVCSTCKTTFTCPPPTRQELMESFTGPEIAALIEPGKIIAAHPVFSEMLQKEMNDAPLQAALASYRHWLRGVYLITSVEEEEGQVEVELDSQEQVEMLRTKLGADRCIRLRDRTFELVAERSLAGVSASELSSALDALQAPCTVVLRATDANSCSHDTVTAVNLTRPVRDGALQEQVERARARGVHLQGFVGGPCDDDEIVSCIVLGGREGYTVKKSLDAALDLAARRAATDEARGGLCAGVPVRLSGLEARADLNGRLGLTCRFSEAKARWAVRVQGEASPVMIRPSNLSLEGPQGTRLLAFVGDARWSRAQLLGEIAKGHWGMCSGGTDDLLESAGKRRDALEARLVYAPRTEMTDEFMRESMDAVRPAAVQAAAAADARGTTAGPGAEERANSAAENGAP